MNEALLTKLVVAALPHIITAIGSIIVAILTIYIGWRKYNSQQHASVYREEIIDRGKFRKALMQEVDNLRKELRECNARCSECEEEHRKAKLELASLTDEVNELRQHR